MHYIVGTSFIVIPNNKSTLSPDRRFKVGCSYTLIRILKKDSVFLYTFICNNDRNKLEFEFKTCSEADQVISKIKREQLPVYYKEENLFPED